MSLNVDGLLSIRPGLAMRKELLPLPMESLYLVYFQVRIVFTQIAASMFPETIDRLCHSSQIYGFVEARPPTLLYPRGARHGTRGGLRYSADWTAVFLVDLWLHDLPQVMCLD